MYIRYIIDTLNPQSVRILTTPIHKIILPTSLAFSDVIVLKNCPSISSISNMSVSHMNTTAQLVTRAETILQYIDILQYLLQQYNTIWLEGNINILHITIYCDILQYIAMLVILML